MINWPALSTEQIESTAEQFRNEALDALGIDRSTLPVPVEQIAEFHLGYELDFTDQEADLLNNEILIVKEGLYLGIGHLKDLLKRITELKIQNATYSNPLTLLPGNVPINHEINHRIDQI